MLIALVCYEAFLQGGIRTTIRELSNRFVTAGHTVVLLAPQPGHGIATGLDPAVVFHSIQLPELPLSSMASFALQVPRAFRRIERELGPIDIVHSHTYADTLLTRGATRGVRLTTIHHLASTAAETMKVPIIRRLRHPSREYGPAVALEGFCIRRADHLIAVSEFTKRDILSRYSHVKANQISVIYPGATPRGSMVGEEAVADVRKLWGLDADSRVLLYVGRLEERKGTALLLDAFASLDRDLNATLLLVGAGDPRTYEMRARTLDIDERVVFAGRVDDTTLGAAYRLASLLVHPASMEGFGLSIADAVACGLPVVATRAGAIPELVRDGIDGFLIDQPTPRALAALITKALNQEKTLRSNSARAGPARFTWEKTSKETLFLYKRLIEGPPSHATELGG